MNEEQDKIEIIKLGDMEAGIPATEEEFEEAVTELQQPVRNPIITPGGDPERWPLLEMASQPCQIPITAADEQAIIDMDAILDALDEEAAGLAAVQIGFPHRIFLLRNGTNEEGNPTNNVYVNPNVVAKSKAITKDGEACLSLPGMGALVPRPKSVTLQYFDLDGNVQEETFTGFWARAVMHEMDHLDGQLISKYIEEQMSKQPSRTKFGMRITPHRTKVIAQRRAKNKCARASRKNNRANRG